jgi:citronellol/citronellal dehydrogenase
MTEAAPTDPLTAPLTYREDLLKDQVILVSGAGSGIGKAIAIQAGRLGAKVVLCGRKVEKLDATAAMLRSIGAEAMVRPVTIRDAEDVERMQAEIWDRFGRLDHLVNNAGGQFPQAAIDYSVKGWNAVIDTNLNGSWYMMQAAARRWRDAGQAGSIVNIVTVVWRGMPGVAHTCAARAGVIYLSKTLAIEWAPLNIRVNCVAPGAIATEGMDVYSEEAQRDLPRSNLMQRYGEARDVADAVTYLTGPSGAFVTGEVMVVDGGNQVWGDQWTIPRPDYFSRQG